MAQNKRTARGRPRKYVPEVALGCAMEVFWDQGFAATSLDQLGEAMGMNRPSIQAAFGDKTELFVKVLRHYENDMRQRLSEALSSGVPLRAALRDMFSLLLDCFFSDAKPARGCLLFTVAAADALRTPVIRDVVAAAAHKLDAAFTERFTVARAHGEVAPTANPAELAVLASGLIHTLSTRARAGEKKDELMRVIDIYLAMIFAAS